MTTLRAIMVDLDGTLARTTEPNVVAYQQALSEFGVFITAQELEARVQGRHWREFLPTILHEATNESSPQAIAARKAELYAANLHTVEINTGLRHLLQACRTQFKTALVTSAARTSVHALLSAHDLATLFDVVITGDDVQHHKPDPEAYIIAARHLEVEPQETLIYEDSDIGVASAKAFGGHVIRILF